jgi:hypothetical protein
MPFLKKERNHADGAGTAELHGRGSESGHPSMIPKSGNRFSGKIMLKQEAKA